MQFPASASHPISSGKAAQTAPPPRASLQAWLLWHWENRPWVLVFWAAVLSRLVAVVFARGFVTHDDHFAVTENAQFWAWGLPRKLDNPADPHYDSMVYTGFSAVLFWVMEFGLGITQPQWKAMAERFFHGAYSLLMVWLTYKLALRVAGLQTAKWAGLLMATFWIWPYLSVHPLDEWACLPPLLAAMLVYHRASEKPARNSWLLHAWMGALLGIAFDLRYNTAFFTLGLGCWMLWRKQWSAACVSGAAFLAAYSAVKLPFDLAIWHKPYFSFFAWVSYNFTNAGDYPTGPFYNYFLLIVGIMFVPMGFFFWFGYFRKWRAGALFWPSFLFFIFHSYFENKQERFILPFIPFFFILGAWGWQSWLRASGWWRRRSGLWSGIRVSFWGVNTILMIVLLFHYGKKSQVQATGFFYDKPAEQAVRWDFGGEPLPVIPEFYYGRPPLHFAEFDPLSGRAELEALAHSTPKVNYVVLMGTRDLRARFDSLRTVFPLAREAATFRPSLVDRTLTWLNPVNQNHQTTVVELGPAIAQ